MLFRHVTKSIAHRMRSYAESTIFHVFLSLLQDT